ncbi:hypothetical protein [Deinococcus soli (ex Cha et al. 2016)]|uniref:Uncharacterized protein n=2 Tax=Deinococcus soli (ex Cha et al. 2016) TaxID=1309411 RepID=A0ACC6KI45_9DEIO|nr:hypothetical protein [Deinococcus soli (ex Cha et al. 2016)]MDR6219329.1 hypothetical protein [Deinococcus soli (ex Cha et al. 2016)]MDR6329578.1 hypothetical protein [Deinococcus soli (ex Cha et al. 2016)]MDR6752238.1 hypothetical protein [Deinococcus soli (ex Cha et al. 2016)]
MKAQRYIITRPCLQDGSLRLLKYLEGTFPSAGPITLVDDQGHEHAAQVDLTGRRVTGLGSVYHAQNLGVNDVLMITPIQPGRFQVESIVKPHAPPPAPRRDAPKKPETRRVVVASTPHVREVRLQEVRPALNTAPVGEPPRTPDARLEAPRPAETQRTPEAHRTSEAARVPEAPRRSDPVRDPAAAGKAQPDRVEPSRAETARADTGRVTARPAAAASSPTAGVTVRPLDVRFDAPARSVPATGVTGSGAATAALVRAVTPAAPAPAPLNLRDDAANLAELARLTGYRLEDLGSGVLRLNAELGAHSYAVLIATSEAAVRADAWKERADYCVLLTGETDRAVNTPRLTREALEALIDHAQLAPLSTVDLRGYWKAGSVDLEAAASVAELVGAHLAQRGAFSAVLLTLAQQPAHSLVSVQRLAERLGSGVNYAELGGILDTLTRAPFLALTPLPGGQYLLRSGVSDLLLELAEYADGLRRRMRAPAREAVPA